MLILVNCVVVLCRDGPYGVMFQREARRLSKGRRHAAHWGCARVLSRGLRGGQRQVTYSCNWFLAFQRNVRKPDEDCVANQPTNMRGKDSESPTDSRPLLPQGLE